MVKIIFLESFPHHHDYSRRIWFEYLSGGLEATEKKMIRLSSYRHAIFEIESVTPKQTVSTSAS